MNRYATLYNALVTKANKMRKRIIRRQQRQDREDEAMRMRGIMPPRRMAKVVPMRLKFLERPTAETMNREGYLAFKQAVKEMGLDNEMRFYKSAYKDNYLQVLRENMIGEDPESRVVFGSQVSNKVPYSEKQIKEEKDEEKKNLMRLYNSIYRMSTEEFMTLYEKGYIVKLEFIYQGLQDAKEQNFYDEQKAFIAQAKLEGRINRYGYHLTRKEKKRNKSLSVATAQPRPLSRNVAKGKYKARTGHNYRGKK